MGWVIFLEKGLFMHGNFLKVKSFALSGVSLFLTSYDSQDGVDDVSSAYFLKFVHGNTARPRCDGLLLFTGKRAPKTFFGKNLKSGEKRAIMLYRGRKKFGIGITRRNGV
jgi:hypothetical protein